MENCQHCGQQMTLVSGFGSEQRWVCGFKGCINNTLCPKCGSKAKLDTLTEDGKAICSNDKCKTTWVY